MSELDLSSVHVHGVLVPVSDAEVDALESDLGVGMPSGYRAYVTTLGEGGLEDLVRVLPPWQVRAQLEEHQARMSTYWLWGDGVDGFGQDEAMASIPVADTMNGDAVAFLPLDPRLFVLPRDADEVVVGSDGLLGLVEWICAGGLGHRPVRSRSFEPFDSRPMLAEAGFGRTVVTPDRPPPDLAGSPRGVLLAYFAELASVESWAWRNKLFSAAATREDRDELIARTEDVHSRFGTPAFARGQRGTSVTMSGTPFHAAADIRILEEAAIRPDRVRIKAAHGPGSMDTNDYVLDRTGDEWRIASQKPDQGPASPPSPTDPPAGGGRWLRSLLGRRPNG